MSTTSERRYRKRLTLELFPGDFPLVRRAHAAAVLAGQSLREWVLKAMDERLARESAEPRRTAAQEGD